MNLLDAGAEHGSHIARVDARGSENADPPARVAHQGCEDLTAGDGRLGAAGGQHAVETERDGGLERSDQIGAYIEGTVQCE